MTVPPFPEFVDRHREPVYRFLVFSVGPDEAADCLQETFLAALRAYPRILDGSNLRAWALTIAHRKAVDAHRRRSHRPAPVADPPDVPVAVPELPDPALWEAVSRLPPRQRAAIVLRFVSDLSFRRVGEIVGCSEAAARQNVRAGLARLRKEYPRAEA